MLCGPLSAFAQTDSPASDSDYTRAISQFHARDFKGSLSTVNAAMIAFAAMLKLKSGLSSNVTEEIDSNLALA